MVAMHQSKEKEDRNETQSCDRREYCPFFDARRYLWKLREMLPYVPPVNLAGLALLHSARDDKGIIRVVKRLMNIEAITFQVIWVPDGAAQNHKDAPAWVEMPPDMPFYGSKEFKEMTIKMFFRKSFFQRSYDRAILAVAHELSHVVLESIRHPLRKCEKAVDMTAMLLGFSHLYEAASHKEERIGNTISIDTLGYLTREEVRQVNQILAEKPKRPKISVSDLIARAKMPLWVSQLVVRVRTSVSRNWRPKLSRQQLAAPGNLFLGFALCSGIVIWILGTNGAFQSRFVPASTNTAATQALTAVPEKQPTNATAPPSDQIARVQLRLIQLGYLAGRADNVWGKGSRGALRAFKAANALLVNDSWDEETSAALFSANAAYAPAPAVSNAKR
jgi:hypothetical protein